ncbi:hypothetical protein BBD42_14370 [Paenibacillus sp. BIHB 4019]|uniref:Uncharacterized protein n=1 Tax=Paenibacillus sp. BIHB 4019 TaxID=1870819 RepID=A0A1B2DIG3_9BACL|nr:hypothetical protein [Paenibacillus sp. BIHB 4019]ANY67527.1 hypothetical protein BBD42_14370 [Paenibacillus sp. BIHB 4019]
MSFITVVLQSEASSSLLILLKKHTGLGFSEIKSCINNKLPLMTANYVNNDEIQKMKNLVEELIVHNKEFEIFEQNGSYTEMLPLKHFMNSFGMSKQISEDRERMDDLLIPEDDES